MSKTPEEKAAKAAKRARKAAKLAAAETLGLPDDSVADATAAEGGDDEDTDDDDGSTPYGDGAVPVVAAPEDMGDDNFKKHLDGRHTRLLKGQKPERMHNGLALRPYYGAHLREHNAGAGFDAHVHAESEGD